MLLHIMTSFVIYMIEESAISRTNVNIYKNINDIIICIDIIDFPITF